MATVEKVVEETFQKVFERVKDDRTEIKINYLTGWRDGADIQLRESNTSGSELELGKMIIKRFDEEIEKLSQELV